jgi:hypothetical protein
MRYNCSSVPRAGRHTLRHAGATLAAMLACATPALAATPVSDQYQSAPAPRVPAPTATPGAGAPGARGAATKQSAAAAPHAISVTPARGEGARVAAPVGASGSVVPIATLAGLGLLALGVAAGAAATRRRAAAS